MQRNIRFADFWEWRSGFWGKAMLDLPRHHVVSFLSYENTSECALSLCLYRSVTSIVLAVWNILIQRVLNAQLLQMVAGRSCYNGDHPVPNGVETHRYM